MFELIARLTVAVVLLSAAGLTRNPPMHLAWPPALAIGVTAFVAYWLDLKGHRKAGIGGFIAVVDAMLISVVLSSLGELERFGFLTLAPMLWATGRFGSDAASMAPLVAATVMVASNFYNGAGFTVPVMLHTLGVLIVGLLTNQSRVVVKETSVTVPVTKEVIIENAADPKIRDSYQSLKGHVQELEKSGRRDRLAMRLWNSANDGGSPPIAGMASRLCEETTVEGVVVYRADPVEKRFVVKSFAGRIPHEAKSESLHWPTDLGDGQMRHRLEKDLLSRRDNDHPVQCGATVLKDRGKVVGFVGVFDPSPVTVDSACREIQEVSDSMGGLLRQALDRENAKRRLREAEMLYSVAAVAIGSESRASLVARVVRELGDSAGCDHLSVAFVVGESLVGAATHGVPVRLLDDISFAYGAGVKGWIDTGCPEVSALDTAQDERIDRTAALKARIGSFVMVPIGSGDVATAVLTAATQQANGIDSNQLETLRMIAHELGQALARLENPADASGTMLPAEFYSLIRKGGAGQLVYFEVPRRESLVEDFGAPAVEQAVKKIANRIRMKLPNGGGLCRRDEGDFVAYLPGTEEAFARRWGNDCAAIVSGLGLRTPDGSARLPLQIRPKTAPINRQKSQVST